MCRQPALPLTYDPKRHHSLTAACIRSIVLTLLDQTQYFCENEVWFLCKVKLHTLQKCTLKTKICGGGIIDIRIKLPPCSGSSFFTPIKVIKPVTSLIITHPNYLIEDTTTIHEGKINSSESN